MPIWIYHDTTADKLISFDSFDAASTWLEEHDPEGVAFEYSEYEVVPFTEYAGIGWQSVLKNGAPVWHGPEQACLKFVADPSFREECLRSKSLKPGSRP